jgi:hypothetical protein
MSTNGVFVDIFHGHLYTIDMSLKRVGKIGFYRHIIDGAALLTEPKAIQQGG